MDTVIVGSRSTMPIDMGGGAVLNGSGHKSAIGGVGITRGVDKEAFEQFMKDNAGLEAVARGLIFELPDDPKEMEPTYGFEPGLELSAKNEDNTKLSEEGSTVTEPISAANSGEPDNIPHPTNIEVAQTLGAPDTPAPTGPVEGKIIPPAPIVVEQHPAEQPDPPKPKPAVMPDDPTSKPLG